VKRGKKGAKEHCFIKCTARTDSETLTRALDLQQSCSSAPPKAPGLLKSSVRPFLEKFGASGYSTHPRQVHLKSHLSQTPYNIINNRNFKIELMLREKG
jgi:hypothetical protein